MSTSLSTFYICVDLSVHLSPPFYGSPTFLLCVTLVLVPSSILVFFTVCLITRPSGSGNLPDIDRDIDRDLRERHRQRFVERDRNTIRTSGKGIFESV